MPPNIKNFLLAGRPGIGKTTVAEAIIREFEDAGGFVTGEIRESGTRKGFRITTVDGETATLAHVRFSSPVKVGKYGVDLQTLDRVAVPSVRTAIKHKQVIVIDEIGRMELASKTVHPLQIVREALPWRVHDIPVDYIVTPEEIIRTEPVHPRPRGILWEFLPEEKIAAIPILRQRFTRPRK